MTGLECRPLAQPVQAGGFRGVCECGGFVGRVVHTGRPVADRTAAMIDARIHSDGLTPA